MVSTGAGIEWIVQEQIFASARSTGVPKQVWENGWYQNIFGKNNNPALPQLAKRPRLDKLEPEGQTEYVAATSSTQRPFNFQKQRLMLARLVQTEDTVRHGSLRKLKDVICNSLDDSGLGRSLKTYAGNFSEEHVLQSVFSGVFVKKSTGTLAKRSNHLWELQNWLFEMHVPSSFHMTENELYEYIQFLRYSGRGATVGKQTLQAVTFLFHTADADKMKLASLMSSRVKGAADALMALKPPLKQAAPLKCDIVYALESLIFQIKETHLKVILGHLLFCIYACSRFGDSVEMTDLTISHSAEFCLVEAFTKRYKMGNSEKKRHFLPLVALGRCLYYPKPWAVEWFEARDEEMLNEAKFTMPAWSESASQWIHNRPMSTGEAATFLREFLTMAGFGYCAYDFSCHSCKATILSWMAKSNMMDFESRRLLGHHLPPGAASTLVYSRDEMTRLQKSVYQVLVLIRQGEFDPDLDRVSRLRQMLGNDDFPVEHLPEGNDEEFFESDLSEDDLNENEVREAQQIDDLEFESANEYYKALVVNPKSSVVHGVSDNGRLLCGRQWSEEYKDIPTSVQLSSLPFCIQCENSKISKLRRVDHADGADQEQDEAVLEDSEEFVSELGLSDIGSWEDVRL